MLGRPSLRKFIGLLSLAAVAQLAWLGRAAEPERPTPIVDPNVKQAQQPPPIQPPPVVPSTAPDPSIGGPSSAPSADFFAPITPSNLGTDSGPRGPINTVGSVTDVQLAGGQAAPVLNAPDLGELLSKSAAATGLEVQRRNAIISDPRLRGYRVGQLVTLGDGALYFPDRMDLDTAVGKFDPGSVRDVLIYKGPYTALLGSGHAFLDIVTLDAPRFPCGFEAHGRTSFGYQTNGQRWDGLQSVWAGGEHWGFRATYNILTGNNYLSGNQTDVASSYNSNNVNFALGFDLTPNSKIEFKGLRVHQENLDFPGLYFDVGGLDTEAYSLRYTLKDQPFFDRLILDTWYNTTVANGNTFREPKQAFVQQLLFVSFNPQGTTDIKNFTDQSTTHFSNKSLGYRLALGWGPEKGPNWTAGTDLSVLGQTLVENIQITQLTGQPLNGTGGPGQTFNQNQGIPESSWIDPGLFIEGFLPLSDRLKLKSGGRVDFVSTNSDSRFISGNIDLFGPPRVAGQPNFVPQRTGFDPIIFSVDPTDTDLDKSFFLYSSFLSGEYKFDDYLTGLAAFGYSERAPTLTELYATGPFIGVLQQGTSRLIGDPNLSKEKLTQFDLGLKADYGWFRGGVTGFYAFVDDYITFDVNKKGLGLTQVVFTNTDRATLAGGEMYMAADATAWLTPFANLAYVQGVDRTHTDRRRPANLASSRRNDLITAERATASEPLPQIPPLEIRCGLRFHQPKIAPKWVIELEMRNVFAQDSVAVSLDEFPTPAFTVFNLRSYYQITDKWLVSTGVENFGDRNYREHLDPISGNLLGVGPLFRTGTNFYFASQLSY